MNAQKDNNVFTNEPGITINTPQPRPIQPKKCVCGCGHLFQAKRRDQVYLNKQHADYGYNHGKRKAKNKIRKSIEKILSNNDNILDRHYKMNVREKRATCFFEVVRADGFQFGYHIGKIEKKDAECFFTYRYYFNLFKDANGIQKINIFRR